MSVDGAPFEPGIDNGIYDGGTNSSSEDHPYKGINVTDCNTLLKDQTIYIFKGSQFVYGDKYAYDYTSTPNLNLVKENGAYVGIVDQTGTYTIHVMREVPSYTFTLVVVDKPIQYSELVFESDPVTDGVISYA